MDEARAVLARLRRIELLERGAAPRSVLLGEIRVLLGEAEAWIRAEGRDADPAARALERCQAALGDHPGPGGSTAGLC